jgi:hypothetical protein
MYNEERGIKLEYRPSIHGHSKSLLKQTGKVLWVNSPLMGGLKTSPISRQKLKLNPDLLASNHTLIKRSPFSKTLKKSPNRLVGLVRDYTDGGIPKEQFTMRNE